MKFLSRHSVFFLSFAALLFISCENEPLEGEFVTGPGGGNVDLNVDITGVWNMVGYESTVITSGQLGGQNFDETNVITGTSFNAQTEFTASNTYASTGSFTATVTTTAMGETTSVTEQIEVDENGTWTQNGATLTLDDGIEPMSFTITTLTQNLMVIEYQMNENLGGIQVDISGKVTYSR